MANDGKPHDEATAAAGPESQASTQLVTPEGLNAAWDAFRAGAVVYCARDGAPLALAVDGAASLYRFVCTRCGSSSPWFESSPQGVRMRVASTGVPATINDH
jgi:hypothetical protein